MSPFWASGFKLSTYEFLGDAIQPIIYAKSLIYIITSLLSKPSEENDTIAIYR